jgi:DNA primase
MEAEYVKTRTDLVTLIEKSGVALRPGTTGVYRAVCPFHAEHTASLHIWPQKQFWYCYGCNRGGDVFAWVRYRDNCTFAESLQIIKKGGLGAPIVRKPIPAPPPPSPIPDILVEEWHRILLQNEKVLKNLQETRVWSREVIEKYKIGLNDDRITIPIPDPLGLHWGDVRMYQPFARIKGVQKMLPYSSNRPCLPFDTGGFDGPYCLLVEGEPDALAAASAGIPSATHTCGANAVLRVWNTWGGLIAAPKILICYDNDDPGREGAKRVSEVFPGSEIIDIPYVEERGDITDLIRLKGGKWVKEYIETFLEVS